MLIDVMLAAFLILVVGLMPSLVSLWVMRRADERTQQRLSLALDAFANRGLGQVLVRDPDRHYVEGLGYIIGDLSCQFNARSPHIRCAVNPSGPCDQCRHYAPREYAETSRFSAD
jgi:hypothetical protein